MGIRLCYHASSPWEDESLALKVAFKATEKWEALKGGGMPCLVVFDTKDARETIKLDEGQRETDAKAF